MSNQVGLLDGFLPPFCIRMNDLLFEPSIFLNLFAFLFERSTSIRLTRSPFLEFFERGVTGLAPVKNLFSSRAPLTVFGGWPYYRFGEGLGFGLFGTFWGL